MSIIWSLLERAGDWGWAVSGVGITALLLSVIAAFMGWVWRASPRRVISVCVTATGLLLVLLLVGGVATMHGYGRIAEMSAYTSAEDADRIARIGPVLAKAPLWLALIIAGLSSPFLGAAWYRGIADYRRDRPSLRRG